MNAPVTPALTPDQSAAIDRGLSVGAALQMVRIGLAARLRTAYDLGGQGDLGFKVAMSTFNLALDDFALSLQRDALDLADLAEKGRAA